MKKHLKVTIVGGGFGGVKTALELARDKTNHVTLISDNPSFQYYPALFSTATGHDHGESWIALADIFKSHQNVRLVIDRIESIDIKKKQVVGSVAHRYDELVLALGSVTTYFGIEGLDTYSYGIKSQSEIRKLQAHLWNQMSDGSDDEKNYVVIGGGPTGVELAGSLGQYVLALRKQFGIKKKRIKISLIEAAPRVLPRLSEPSSERAHNRLKELGVNVETNMKVEKQTAENLVINGKPLTTQTVIWTSGVANAPFFKANETQFDLNERGKVVVDEFMRSSAHVYVIGDNASTPYAGLAQTALHDGIFVAKHLKGSNSVYKAVMPPCVIPIGDNWAVFEWGKVRFGGVPGGVMRSLADVVGYHDVLPIGWTMKALRAQRRTELQVPASIDT